MGIAEGQFDELLTQDVIVRRLAERAIVIDGFVDHIPTLDLSMEMAYNSHDVLAHALLQQVAASCVAIFIQEHPFGRLLMPYQHMAERC